MRRRVLVVDDEPNIVRALEHLLTRDGFDVQIARDGKEALAALSGAPPDVVLLDVMMPGLDGFELCGLIRGHPAWQATRIVMLTARGREAERERGLALGADAYVTKPFSTRTLVVQVRELLGMSGEAGS